MITNRTLKDVNDAIDIRDNKVKKFKSLTDNEKNILERGLITYNTLNRVENKQDELKNVLNAMGYRGISIVNKKNWDQYTVFDSLDCQRVFDNIRVMRDAFYVYKSTPESPSAAYYWENWNNAEKNLEDIEIITNEVKSAYTYCASVDCGEV